MSDTEPFAFVCSPCPWRDKVFQHLPFNENNISRVGDVIKLDTEGGYNEIPDPKNGDHGVSISKIAVSVPFEIEKKSTVSLAFELSCMANAEFGAEMV